MDSTQILMKVKAAFGNRIASTKDIEEVKAFLDGLIQGGRKLTPELVLEEARPVSSPIHRFFEWDDAAAAEKYRLEQAGALIRSVHVTFIRDNGPPVEQRAYVLVKEKEEEVEEGERGSHYIGIVDAMSSEEYRRQVVQKALQELSTWQKKYRDLNELAEIFAAIERSQAA